MQKKGHMVSGKTIGETLGVDSKSQGFLWPNNY